MAHKKVLKKGVQQWARWVQTPVEYGFYIVEMPPHILYKLKMRLLALLYEFFM
jgi:hypothetical protein